ncbi:MAG: phosphatase PAP2 family protein [Candidatus Saccharibacteria bacterium]
MNHIYTQFKTQMLKDNYWIWPTAVAILFVLLALFFPELKGVDSFFIHLIKSLPHSYKPVMEFISNIASVPVMSGAIVVSLVTLAIMKKWKFFWTFLIGLSAMPLYAALKLLTKRSRPNGVVVDFGFSNDSFPSGHSASSLIVLVMIAYIVDKNLNKTWSRIVAGIVGFLVVAIGVSRIYLGFHYPTDVLGGWLVALFVFLIVKRTADGSIESDSVK